jgi:hypothetical protein
MRSAERLRGAAVAALLALAGAGGCGRPALSDAAPREVLAERADGPHWYRGNLHAHTLWSDGDDYPEMVADWYRGHGYQFLALTDHDVLPAQERWVDAGAGAEGAQAYAKLVARFPGWVEERQAAGHREVRLRRFDEVAAKLAQPGRFLLLSGEEISASHGTASVHLNAINLGATVAARPGADVAAVVANNLAAARAQARPGQPVLVHANHPNFTYALTAEQLAPVRDLRLLEVYNGHPTSADAGDVAHPPVERLWDIVLAHRIAGLGLPPVYGVANDDSHQYHHIPSGRAEPGRGWVMVLADELTPAALVEAMDRGRFYASTGVRLARIETSDEGMRVIVAAEPGVDYRIDFIGTRRGFDASGQPPVDRAGKVVYGTRRYGPDVGAVLDSVAGASADYVFRPDDLYVRALVTASRRHPNPSQPLQFEQAWVQPRLGPAARGLVPTGVVPPPPDVALHSELTPAFVEQDAAQVRALVRRTTPDCRLEVITDGHGRVVPRYARAGGAGFGYWIVDRSGTTAPDGAGVLLVGDRNYLADGGTRAARPDVAASFATPDFERAGFNLGVGLGNVAPGEYAVHLIAYQGADAVDCATPIRMRID